MAKVFLPKGSRDLMPAMMNRRLKVIETVREVFSRYGFEPLETPAFERIETLTGKYGDEGEKLMFRILKRGEGGQSGQVDLALRYDLTVPLARVMAMNPGIPLPFKRSQIQPVWRAERPQKGRFREFYQCDVDTIGSASPIADAECIAVVHDALTALGFTDFTIRINHRQILAKLATALNASDQESSLLQAIDKLSKIGQDGVSKELADRGFSPEQIADLWRYLGGSAIPNTEDFTQQLHKIVDIAIQLGVDRNRVQIDTTLARGLDYYTGPVFETVLNGGYPGSISGGGRYDGLIGMFSGKGDVPAVGVSLGIERIFMLMEEMGLLPDTQTSTQVWATVFSEDTRAATLQATATLRNAGIRVQVSTREGKLGKQFKDAASRGVPFALVCGPEEQALGTVVLKNLSTGAQISGTPDEVATRLAANDEPDSA